MKCKRCAGTGIIDRGYTLNGKPLLWDCPDCDGTGEVRGDDSDIIEED